MSKLVPIALFPKVDELGVGVGVGVGVAVGFGVGVGDGVAVGEIVGVGVEVGVGVGWVVVAYSAASMIIPLVLSMMAQSTRSFSSTPSE